MNDRWPYPISMTLQRHSGSAPKPRELARAGTPVTPTTAPERTPVDTEAAPILQPPERS